MIKRVRRRLGYTQNQLSKITGISQGYISKLESKLYTHSPTLRQIVKLSTALNISPYTLAEHLLEIEIALFSEDTKKYNSRIILSRFKGYNNNINKR